MNDRRRCRICKRPVLPRTGVRYLGRIVHEGCRDEHAESMKSKSNAGATRGPRPASARGTQGKSP